jgi:hypothetical protein
MLAERYKMNASSHQLEDLRNRGYGTARKALDPNTPHTEKCSTNAEKMAVGTPIA